MRCTQPATYLRARKIVCYVDAKSHHSFPNSSMIIYSRDDVILLLMVTDRFMKLSFILAEHWFRHGGVFCFVIGREERRGEKISVSVQTVTKTVTKRRVSSCLL